MKTSVLVTSAGSLPAVAVIKALRAQCEVPLRIVGCDMARLASGAFLVDDFGTVPPARSPGYVRALLKLARRKGVRWIFPVMDEELLPLSRSRGAFERAGVGLIINNPRTVALAKDKWKSYLYCRRQGIRVPNTERLDGRGFPRVGFPFLVKPRRGRGSAGVREIFDRAEWKAVRRRFRGWLAQSRVRGREFTLDLVARPDGEVLGCIPRERIVTKAGTSYKGATRRMPALRHYAARIARAFGVDGPANVQCIVRGGKIWFLELNPKFGTGLSLTAAAGVNVPLIHLKMAMGTCVTARALDFKHDLYMLRYWEEVFVDAGGRGVKP
ncbi:MAG: ATP-grasp domain-containing protein [Candidatus Omnitrophica bacterium]|nr:ATP-grasp domain-containing protein [Candidatus Omnitrophota bacterium]